MSKLGPSPRNVRKHSDATADAELKASIASVGLLQNLLVWPAAKGRYTVEAGKRRRQALMALADDKVLPHDHPVSRLVLEPSGADAVEASLAENFHRLNINPADEAQAFATLIAEGASTEDVARRFGLTVRFVEGRLRLANLAPVVFAALAAGDITLDLAKAYGATSDREIQARVFEQISTAYYAPTAASIRCMVLAETVRGNDPRARLVGREAYEAAGGRVARELFDDEDSEAWLDVALLEQFAVARMDAHAAALTAEQGLAWVRPTLESYASHDMVQGLARLACEAAPMSEAEAKRLEALDAAYAEQAAVLEDEESDDDAVRAAEAELDRIEQESRAIRDRPQVLAPDLRAQAGMILTLGHDGTPVLQPVYYTERSVETANTVDDGVERVCETTGNTARRSVLSKRLVDELAMQRRDVLALHVASDPGLALDVLVFVLADVESIGWHSRSPSTLRGGAPSGPIMGFEPADAPATAALAELRASLDETWRSGETMAGRFELFRALDDEACAGWLGLMVGRTLEASLNLDGDRRIAFLDHLGGLVGIDIARWWRPTAANYFDRVSKQVILDALTDIGGLELSSRFASVKKRDLAMSAERVFAGSAITEVDVRERALAWVRGVMRFAPMSFADDDVSESDPAPEVRAQIAELDGNEEPAPEGCAD